MFSYIFSQNPGDITEKNYIIIKKKHLYSLLILSIIIIIIIFVNKLENDNKQREIKKYGISDINSINKKVLENKSIYYNKCYIPFQNSNISFIHLIITRFLVGFNFTTIYQQKFREKYIINGIRVMKNYLFPSLEKQRCKNFIWVLMLGNGANITFIDYLINFNYSFQYNIIYEKNIKNYIRNISKGFNFLITTRIDNDDSIYYDAVNDVRKAININNPVTLHGYNSGAYYFEFNGKFYEYYIRNNVNNEGVMSIFISLIIDLKKVNDSYNIYDLGEHYLVRKNLLENYKSFGIRELKYEPAIFDYGSPKFIYVRQKFSMVYRLSRTLLKNLKEIYVDLNKFYGIE